jgi:hypothetical protein
VTSSNEQPARRGFLASLSAALSPPQIPENDTGPLTAPKGVITATVLSIIAGAMYLFSGGISLAGTDAMMSKAKSEYATQVQDCTRQFGGIGTTAVTATSPTGTAATCQKMTTLADSDWDAYRTASIVVAVAFVVMGLLLVLAGWFLRAGRAWARRTVVGVVIITVLAALMLGVSTPFILAATLLAMIAVVLCYVSSGSTYFLRVKARKHA